jgi:hypothetical protein
MRGTIHLVAILLTVLSVGCAATVDIVVDEREDLSPCRTWDWLPHARSSIEAPHGDAAALDARLARLIEQHLVGNGFERVGGRADFFVSYRLVLRHQTAVVIEPRAAHELSSHHSTGSFLIEGSERVTRDYAEIHLAIGVTEARGRTLWHAGLMQQAEDSFALKLDDAVAVLLERFPRHRPRNDTDRSDRHRSFGGDASSVGDPLPDRGVRDRKGDSDREPRPDSGCPGGGFDSDRPGSDPVQRRSTPESPA